MEMNYRKDQSTNQIGFHYFQDTTHYTNRDLTTWLPELKRLSASWVILLSDTSRAIPEQFITGMINSNITPIIHFPLRLPDAPAPTDLKAILEAYFRWGIKYVVFFDKPNENQSWSTIGWSHQDLVERFIDRFLPLALEADRIGLTPVFPPLQPGGSYWDTSFFRSAMQSIQRRGQTNLLEKMAVGAYAYTFSHELDWGAGGPKAWPLAKPYSTSADAQDQKGFNNYVWLDSIAKEIGIKNLQFIQFAVGTKEVNSFYSPEIHCEIVKSILQKIKNPGVFRTSPILACNFWLLSAENNSDEYSQAWIKPGFDPLPIVQILSPITEVKEFISFPKDDPKVSEPESELHPEPQPNSESHPISHYLLLPTYEWGIADWHLEVTRPFIRKYRPTVGFSIEEASLAKKVTIIGGEQSFSADAISALRTSGSDVDQILGDGTSIATQLQER
ncbi:MAG: hypothetical protein NTZ74_07290 [Chloroflexi bacterium]|nr:hypothetical protein [Chloroflexota bacterium]